MDFKKTSTPLLILILSVVTTYFFWEKPLILSLILVTLSILKHKLLPLKKELFWYLFIFIFGTIGEIIITKSGAWYYYPEKQILGIPLWLPFLWGLTGTTAASLYQSFVE